MKIRLAAAEDAEAILAVYAPYVRNTAITFEYEVPEADTFRARVEKTLRNYPYLAAEEDGKIVGYAYAGALRERAAYQHIAETSVYLDGAYRRRGIGRALYRELEARLVRQNVFSVYACITGTDRAKDPFADGGSVPFHEKMGYREVGKFPRSGYKFGRWYDVVWMEKSIADRPENPEPFIPFSGLTNET